VSGDESAIVPPQSSSNRSPEWPKKIRTLTASELDRLTIDSAGRFYWDNKLVNYEPPEVQTNSGSKVQDSADRSAMEIIDRAVDELGDHRRSPVPIEGAELPKSGEHRAVDLDVQRHAVETAQLTQLEAAISPFRSTDRVRVTMSRWQSFGAVIVVLGIVVGATGVAAYGWVAAHDWACRIGVTTSHCPPVVAPKAPPRADIPA